MHLARHFAPAGLLRALAYRFLWGCSDVFQKAANACLYVAAGLLRRDELRHASQIAWREFGTAVDDIDAGLDTWERQVYDNLLLPSDRVLLVGCGTGRDLLALLKLGYDVSGLEQAPELADIAREHLKHRGMNATVRAGPIETSDLDDTYDVVIFSTGCYSYVHHATARVATLARIKTRLSDEGRILVSYYGFGRQSPFWVWLIRMGSRLARTDWRPEHGDSFSRDHLARGILRYQHGFRPGEVARECTSAGLRVIRDEATTSPFHYAVAVPAAAARGEPAEQR